MFCELCAVCLCGMVSGALVRLEAGHRAGFYFDLETNDVLLLG